MFLPGPDPCFILKSAASVPRLVGLQSLDVVAMSAFNTDSCEHGFIYVDSDGIARVAQLPALTDFTTLGVPVRKINLGFDVHSVAHHPPTDTYIVAGSTHHTLDPKEDAENDGQAAVHGASNDKQSATSSLSSSVHPHGRRGVLKLVSPIVWEPIYTLDLDNFESVECMRTVLLEVSEESHERRMLVAVGLSIARGEDVAVKGAVIVLDIVPVIPFPDRPQSDHRLRRVAREDLPRGAVTAISEVGSQGLMLVAQGQKCLVRGLKEDGTLLPVAFLDMSCHVTAVTELRGSGLCIMADAVKGLWFTGYTEEPYRMMILGKSASRLQLVLADFLPVGRDLAIIAVDVDGDLHVLEFNPDGEPSLCEFDVWPFVPRQYS